MNRPLRLTQLLVAVLALLLVAACSPSSGDGGTVAPPPSTTVPSVEPPSHDATPGTPEPSASPSGPASPSPSSGPTTSPSPSAGTTIVRAYFFLSGASDEGGLVPVLREIPATKAVATAAMEALLAGPSASERGARPSIYSVIPQGTRLLGLRIEDGIAIVNLSKEYEAGGGSLSIFARLAQVVYTLTQFPTVTGVSFELDGAPVTVFSGEGVILDEPVTRADYRDELLPEIFVDRPAWGAAANNPARVTGLTRVFEATFQVQLIDGSGTVLTSQTVTATCGTGCWGSFDVTLPYDVSRAQWGTLRVFAYSARDGAPENIRDYPVWLTPAR